NWAEAVTSAQFARHAASLEVPATRTGDSGCNPASYLHRSNSRGKRQETMGAWLHGAHRAPERAPDDARRPIARGNRRVETSRHGGRLPQRIASARCADTPRREREAWTPRHYSRRERSAPASERSVS